MKRITYPSCFKTFINFCEINKLTTHKNYSKIMDIKLFDITLSYGLYNQNLNYETTNKLNLYNKIMDNYNVHNFELGIMNHKSSFENNDSIFNDTIELLDIVEYKYYNNFNKDINNYVVFRNNYDINHSKYELIKMLSSGVKNFSFSLSKIYHFKEYHDSTKIKKFNQLYNLLLFLQNLPPLNLYKNNDIYSNNKPFNIQLYIDYEYQTNRSEIISNLFYLHKFNIDKICIVDRYGKMKKNDLLFLLENIKKYFYIEHFSLQFHCNKLNEHIIEELFHIALDYGINEFNINENILDKHTKCDKNIIPVLYYQTYYKWLTNYLLL